MNKSEVKINKNLFFLIISSTFIIIILLLIILLNTLNNNNKIKQVNTMSFNDEQVIEYLENNDYEIKKYIFESTPNTIYVTISNDKIEMQKIDNPYIGTVYFFDNNLYNDNYADIMNLSKNNTDEKKEQYYAYKKWLDSINLTDEQIISALKYYDKYNKADIYEDLKLLENN